MKKVLEKLNEVMGKEKELMVMKGQCINPAKVKKKDSNDTYYTIGIKTIKRAGNEYMQGYNTYQIIIPVEKSREFTDEQIKSMKNNEVICLVQPNCYIKKIGDNAKVNNITFYLQGIMVIREIDTKILDAKAMNL